MLAPDLDDLRIQGFAGAGAMTQCGQVNGIEAGLDQHPVLGRRRAEIRDAITA